MSKFAVSGVIFLLCVNAASGFLPTRPVLPRQMTEVRLAGGEIGFAMEKLPSVAKGAVIAAMFGGGLIPAAIAANKSMFSLMAGSKGKKDFENQSGKSGEGKSLDPTAVENVYVEDSIASGSALPV